MLLEDPPPDFGDTLVAWRHDEVAVQNRYRSTTGVSPWREQAHFKECGSGHAAHSPLLHRGHRR